ncbi:hypothetical protein [Paenibacillus massiliensis]|uniref:hypothetical protein n=1 Tax=Paenibacillus massiliensis TaxID=225917 RepID=UPI000369A8CB|nr:hypothetical protein [Paenibacillus massiliensis]
MKLIHPLEAAESLMQDLEIPSEYTLMSAEIIRNSQPDELPLYKLELQWTFPEIYDAITKYDRNTEERMKAAKTNDNVDQGEHVTGEFETELVSNRAIYAEMDAVTGRLISLIRHDLKPVLNKHALPKSADTDMDEATFNRLLHQQLDWMERMKLNIRTDEMLLQKAVIKNDGGYRFCFGRQHQGVRVSSYQTIDMECNAKDEVIQWLCKWDDCEFEVAEQTQSVDAVLSSAGADALSLGYILLVSKQYPYYVCLGEGYHAVSGELIFREKAQQREMIQLNRNASAEENKAYFHLELDSEQEQRPVFAEEHYEALKLAAGVTEVDPYAPHPFAPFISDDEVVQAKAAAVSYLEQQYASEPYEFAFLENTEQKAVEAMQGHQLQVDVHRVLHGIVLGGGRIRMVIDRSSGRVTHAIDALELQQLLDMDAMSKEVTLAGVSGGREKQGTFLIAERSLEEAWRVMKPHIDVRLSYRIQYNGPLAAPRAIPIYTLACDQLFNAVTGEIVSLH